MAAADPPTATATGPRPLVTVGIPFFNNAATLADAVRSVFAQTLADWELILADDGSADGSLAVARSVSDPRVCVLSDGVNRGLVYRLNQISNAARGKYVARMDADDLADPRRLRLQVERLERTPDVDVVDAALYSVDDALRPTGKRGLTPLRCDLPSVLRSGMLLHATILGRVEWFLRNPYLPGYGRAEDYELWARTCAASRFARVAEPLYFYRESYGVSVRNYLGSSRGERKVLRQYGPAALGRAGTWRLMARSYAKGAAYVLLGAAGLQHVLARRRSEALTEEEARRAEEVIAAVRATEVPGLAG